MNSPTFRLVCVPAALISAPGDWASEMLAEGEIALLADDGGLAAIDAVSRELGLVSVPLIRGEDTPERQQQTVIAYADSLPVIWVADTFTADTARWARDRGPMTLLIETGRPLSDDERRRIGLRPLEPVRDEIGKLLGPRQAAIEVFKTGLFYLATAGCACVITSCITISATLK